MSGRGPSVVDRQRERERERERKRERKKERVYLLAEMHDARGQCPQKPVPIINIGMLR